MTCYAYHADRTDRPGDRQAIPGILNILKNNQTKWQVGNNANLFDWTYVDNIVHAHLLAAEKLSSSIPRTDFLLHMDAVGKTIAPRELPTSAHRIDNEWLEGEVQQTEGIYGQIDPPLEHLHSRFDQFASIPPEVQEIPVAGQAYFITNGEPIPFWSLARSFWWHYAQHQPKTIYILPAGFAYFMGVIGETVSKWLGRESGFTAQRMVFATTQRYFNIEKSRRMLGYEPLVGLEDAIKRTAEVRCLLLLIGSFTQEEFTVVEIGRSCSSVKGDNRQKLIVVFFCILLHV